MTKSDLLGWAWPVNCRKAHLIDPERRSLCGRWMYLGKNLEKGNDGSPDNCPSCLKALAKLPDSPPPPTTPAHLKYQYEYVLQGYYPGTNWEDLTAAPATPKGRREVRANRDDYLKNAPGPYRIIKRRSLNPLWTPKLGVWADKENYPASVLLIQVGDGVCTYQPLGTLQVLTMDILPFTKKMVFMPNVNPGRASGGPK